MKIAVITPYFNEPLSKIRRCHFSVRHQSTKVTHFLVADGNPRPEIDAWDCVHIKLGKGCADYGDTPRMIGSATAIAQGFEAILLLDADNWFGSHHVEGSLLTMTHYSADVVTCPRMLHREDESELGECRESDGVIFNDTNCYLFGRRAFPLLSHWGFKDPKDGIIGDRIFWDVLRKQTDLKIARASVPSVHYETTFACHYQERGETPPSNAKAILLLPNGKKQMVDWHSLMAGTVQVVR